MRTGKMKNQKTGKIIHWNNNAIWYKIVAHLKRWKGQYFFKLLFSIRWKSVPLTI